MRDFVRLAGRSERDPFSLAAQALEQFADARKRTDAREVFLFENFAAELVRLFPEFAHFALGQKFRQIVIAPFPDLAAEFLQRNFLSEMPERFLPRLHMQFVGIDQRPIEIEDRGADHFSSARLSAASGNGGGFAVAAGFKSRGNST